MRRLVLCAAAVAAGSFLMAHAATAAPDLAATKRAVDNDGAPLERGDLVLYVIEIANRGADPATATVFHDPISSDFEGVVVVSIPADARDESDLGGPAPFVRITGFALPAGETRRIVFSAFVAASAPGPSVCNQGEVTSAEIPVPVPSDDPATAAAGDPTCLALGGSFVALRVTKEMVDANGAPAAPGDTLIFTVHVDNTGSAAATAVSVVDPLAAAFASATVVLIPAGASDSSMLGPPPTEVRIEDFAVPAGGRETVVFTATLDPAAAGSVCNQAFAGSAEVPVPVGSDDPVTGAPGDPTCAVLPGRPDLVIRKRALDLDGAPVERNDRLTYVLELHNPGGAALAALTIDDMLPRDVRDLVVLALPPGAVDLSTTGGTGPRLHLEGIALAAGSSAVVAYAVAVAPSASGEICNQATGSSTELAAVVVSDDPVTLAAADPTCVPVGPAPDLTATTLAATDASGPPLQPGDAVDFVIEVRNTGTAGATGVVVEQAIPAGLVNVVVNAIPPGATDASMLGGPAPRLVIEGFDVAAGAAATVAYTAEVDAVADGSEICTRAETRSVERPQPVGSDDPATAAALDPTCVVVGPALATSTKVLADADREAVDPGDLVFYAIDVRNHGSGDAAATRLTDLLPAGLANLALVSIPPGAVDASDLANRTVDVSGFTVAAGAVERVVVAGEVEPVPPPSLCNQGLLSAATLPGPIPSDDPSTLLDADPTCVGIGLGPALEVSKEVVPLTGTAPAAPGDLLLYVIRIANTGNGPARLVRVVDALVDLVEPRFVALPEGAVDLTDVPGLPLVLVVELPRVESGATATLAFVAQVAPAPRAAEVCNRALVSSLETLQPVPSDDPATAAVGDATCLVASPTTPVPAVTGIFPCRGTKEGGTEVTITGSGFAPGLTVTFDGIEAQVLSVSATSIVVVTPRHPPVGPVDVVVTNPDGAFDLVSAGYVYTPPPFPIRLHGKKAGSSTYLVWTGGVGDTRVVLRSDDPQFACDRTDTFTSSGSSFEDRKKDRGKVTFYRVD